MWFLACKGLWVKSIKNRGGDDKILDSLGGFLKKYGFHTEKQKQGEETEIGKRIGNVFSQQQL